MGPEYLESDVDRLFMAASLVDSFWWGGGIDRQLHGEIRLALAPFGTTPLDRRRLDWTLERPDPGDEGSGPESPLPPTGTDARSILRVVK
jgi:hypothetical protein